MTEKNSFEIVIENASLNTRYEGYQQKKKKKERKHYTFRLILSWKTKITEVSNLWPRNANTRESALLRRKRYSIYCFL